MKKNMVKVTINNAALAKVLGLVQGAVIDVECKNGIPINREWRNRFKDAGTDSCISVVKPKPKKGAD